MSHVTVSAVVGARRHCESVLECISKTLWESGGQGVTCYGFWNILWDFLTFGLLDFWTFRLWDFGTLGLFDFWTSGLWEFWALGFC